MDTLQDAAAVLMQLERDVEENYDVPFKEDLLDRLRKNRGTPPGVLSADNPLPLFGSSRRDAPRSAFAAAGPCHGRRYGVVADGTVPRTQMWGCGNPPPAVTEDLHEPKGGSRRYRTRTKCRSF